VRTKLPPKAKLIPEKAERVFAGKLFDVYQWQQVLYDGSFETFEMLKRPDTVNVFAIKDNKLVIQRQEQAEFYSVPGGRHDNPNETELAAAKRELLEETGMTFKNWRLIWIDQPSRKMEWFIYTFLATDFGSQVEPQLDAGEKIQTELMTLDEVKSLIGSLDASSQADFVREIFDNITTIEDLKNWPEVE
jgi:ADP-ribose pyrophosphatase YjhB (NUDIX family)